MSASKNSTPVSENESFSEALERTLGADGAQELKRDTESMLHGVRDAWELLKAEGHVWKTAGELVLKATAEPLVLFFGMPGTALLMFPFSTDGGQVRYGECNIGYKGNNGGDWYPTIKGMKPELMHEDALAKEIEGFKPVSEELKDLWGTMGDVINLFDMMKSAADEHLHAPRGPFKVAGAEHSGAEKGRNTDGRQVYEMVGSSLNRLLKDMPDGPDRRGTVAMLKVYERAHLFLVGWDEPTFEAMFEKAPDTDDARDFRLPFDEVVLCYPGLTANSPVFGEHPWTLLIRRMTEVGEDAFAVTWSMMHTETRLPNTVGCRFDVNRETGEILVNPALMKEFIPLERLGADKTKLPYGSSNIIARTMMGNSVRLAIHSMAYINAPMNYIVREGMPLTKFEQRRKDKAVKPFFSKKDLHIVLDHSQVKVLMPESGNGHHASPVPHERRGHWRQLRAERFREKKTVWVRPADINTGLKWEKSGRTYEVIR
ncbi:MAG: hypothetical protein ACYC69_02580 [Thermodesulfovibrionales bacterium]